jgi:hypothetical protein
MFKKLLLLPFQLKETHGSPANGSEYDSFGVFGGGVIEISLIKAETLSFKFCTISK